jgi:hypothetical protein
LFFSPQRHSDETESLLRENSLSVDSVLVVKKAAEAGKSRQKGKNSRAETDGYNNNFGKNSVLFRHLEASATQSFPRKSPNQFISAKILDINFPSALTFIVKLQQSTN